VEHHTQDAVDAEPGMPETEKGSIETLGPFPAARWRKMSRQKLGDLAIEVLVQETLELFYALVLPIDAA
jgi:hypothetical protein